MTLQELYLWYCNAVVFVEVESPDGSLGIGTAFHVGEGVFITARHVVNGKKIVSVGTTTNGYHPDSSGDRILGGIRHKEYFCQQGRVVSGPYFHPDDDVDVAAVVIEGIEAPAIALNTDIYGYFADDEFILWDVIVMGYPPISFSDGPRLVTVKGNVSSIIDKYTGGAPHFIVSSMARGGFSGGPCLAEDGTTLGVITESLTVNDNPAELGFLSVLTVKPIYVCLIHNKLIPEHQAESFDEIFLSWREPKD